MIFVLRRLGYYVIAFWASLTLNFLLPRLMPGDPVGRMLATMQGTLSDAQVAGYRRLFGLDDSPVWQQYLRYIGDVFTGNMGISISKFPTPVSTVIGSQIGWTILLGGTALIISVVIGNLLGVLAAWRRGGALDSVLPPILVFLGSFPYFFVAMTALYLFGAALGWFPIGQAFTLGTVPTLSPDFIGDVLYHLVLPAGTIVLVTIGGWLLGMRNTMIATAAEDYITMARAKGLTEGRIMFRYAARNAMLPAVTSFGISVGFVVGGALLTEVVFAYPGIGYQLFSAVQAQDYPLMQGIFLTLTGAVLVANFMVDIAYVRLDPRVRAR